MADGLLERYVREEGGACPSCGYDLAGLTGDRCPECGERLVLRIGVVEPRVGLLVFGLVGFSIGLGFSLIVLGFAAWQWVAQGYGGIPLRDLVPLCVGTVLCGFGVGAWVVCRARIRRWRWGVRWPVALLAWGLSISVGVWFFGQVR